MKLHSQPTNDQVKSEQEVNALIDALTRSNQWLNDEDEWDFTRAVTID